MKCYECGAAEMRVEHRDHAYVESGLSNVLLLGLEYRVCLKCSAEECAIRRMAQLHRLIATAVAKKRQRLTGAEIRYLRKHLCFPREDLGRVLDVSAETVLKWENHEESMGTTAERLLRLMVLRGVKIYLNEQLADVACEDACEETRSAVLKLRAGRYGWTVESSGPDEAYWQLVKAPAEG